MAYYNKQDIVSYINSATEKIKQENHQPTTNPEEAIQKLTDEQDLVGFFWLELKPTGESGIGINMEGKVFVRLNADIYTDDRFALDSYHAAKEGCSVTDIIKKREAEKKEASKQVGSDVIENLKNFLSNINK
jgi:hypothetical protein